MKSTIFIPLCLILFTSFCAHKQPEIQRSEVERIINRLADDNMMGRRAFTPFADSAANFIAGEFQRIGLQKWDGLDGYLQKFQMYTIKPDSVTISADGQPISNFFSYTTQQHVHWTQADSVKNIVLGENDDLRSVFGKLQREGKNAVVWTNEAHQDLFSRYSRYLSSGARTMNMEKQFTIIFAMTNKKPETYSIDLSAEVTEQPLENVVGMIEGNRKDEFVLFSAHYDHIGIRPAVEGDSIANGANDDASGTAAVIELADYFKNKEKPERSILFVAFTAEEAGGYGSQYFSRQLDPDKIVAMFNIEMIGKPATDGPNSAWITGWDKSDFGQILQKAVDGTEYKFYPDPYPDQNLFYRSDNATLARLGVPAHSISTTPIDVDKDYHQVSDEVSTLDLVHLTNTIKAIAAGAVTIISGKETPTRVDPTTVNE